jgi:hypothetical protein
MDVLEIVSLEVAIALLMKGNQNRHDLAQNKRTSPLPGLTTLGKERFTPLGFKALAEIINRAEQFF